MLKKICEQADFKMIEEGSGSFEGYGSRFSNRDLAGEVVVKGAFAKTLDAFKQAGFIAVGHDWGALPVATVADAYEDEKGLFVKGDFHSTEAAQATRTYVRERLDRGKAVGLSIGYNVKDSERTKDGLLLKEIELWECSLVTVPCNPLANATGVKALDDAPAWSLGALQQQCDAFFADQIQPLLFDGDSSDTERLTATDAAVADFAKGVRLALRAALLSAPDDDAKAELEAEFKQIFSVPARTAGRYDRQLLALHTEAEGALKRAEEIAALREGQGRPLCSKERFAQLKAFHEAYTSLLDRLAPTPDDLDLPLLQMKANARRRRLVALGEGAPLA